MWLYRIRLLVFISATWIIFCGQVAPGRRQSKQLLPHQFSLHLDSLQNEDSLAEWLFSYMDFVTQQPVQRISFLERAHDMVWRQPKTTAEKIAWFNFLANIGYYELYTGNILRSIEAYEEDYRFYFNGIIPEADVLEYVLKPLGNNYTRLGDYDRAFFIQQKSLTIAEKSDTVQIASICHNLATTALGKGDFELAKSFCEKGLQKVIRNSALHGLLLSTLSEVLLRSNNINEAETDVRKAIRILEKKLNEKNDPDIPYWLRGAYQQLGDVQKEKKQLEAAFLSYQKANSILEKYYKGERKREKAKLFVLMGDVLLQMQKPIEAMEKYDNSLGLLLPSYTKDSMPSINNLYGENTLVDALGGKAKCFLKMNNHDKALQYFMQVFAVQKKLRREFFSVQAKQQQQKEAKAWAEDALEVAYGLWETTKKDEYAKTILVIMELSKSQLLLDEMATNLQYNRIKNKDTVLENQFKTLQAISFYEKKEILDKDTSSSAIKKELQYKLSLIEKDVKKKYPALQEYSGWDELPSADSLLKNIKDKTTVIEYFVGEKNIYILTASKNSFVSVKIIANSAEVSQQIKDFSTGYFQQGPAKMMDDPHAYYKAANHIYSLIWPKESLNSEEEFVVIPDGIIGYVSFDALITDSVYRSNINEWPFLIQQKNIRQSYSLQALQQQQHLTFPNTKFSGFFISFDSVANLSLRAVKKEYENISRIVAGHFYENNKASLKKFQEEIPSTNLLHVSTHSSLQGKDSVPAIELADDRFFLFELYGQSFRPQLVVLSACRTGHGILAEGEGIISLARGFTVAGAGGIVAGLWNMNDESTAELMGNFYRQLEKISQPAEALRSAKLNWLKEKHAYSFENLPYYWAGLIYSGNNKPISIPEKKSTKEMMWWVVAGLLIVGIIWLIKKRKEKRKTAFL